MNKKDKKNQSMQMTFKFVQPYTVKLTDWYDNVNYETLNGGFTDDAVDKLLEIADGDWRNLDRWITEQLHEIEAEIAEEKRQLEFDFSSHDTLENQREMFDRLFKE